MEKKKFFKSLVARDSIILYGLHHSLRARHLRLTVHPDGRVVLSVPRGVSDARAQAFLRAKAGWVAATLAKFARRGPVPAWLVGRSRAHYLRHKEAARELVRERVAHWSGVYRLRPSAVRVKNQRSRWGSCSRTGNLNFNYRLLFLPERLRDYVVAHELCHLAEFNHSSKFWDLVAQNFPDHRNLRRALRRGGMGE